MVGTRGRMYLGRRPNGRCSRAGTSRYARPSTSRRTRSGGPRSLGSPSPCGRQRISGQPGTPSLSLRPARRASPAPRLVSLGRLGPVPRCGRRRVGRSPRCGRGHASPHPRRGTGRARFARRVACCSSRQAFRSGVDSVMAFIHESKIIMSGFVSPCRFRSSMYAWRAILMPSASGTTRSPWLVDSTSSSAGTPRCGSRP